MAIFAELGNRWHLHYLVNLDDLNRVRSVNYGFLTYSTLIYEMRQGMRKTECTCGEQCTSIPLRGMESDRGNGFFPLLLPSILDNI